MGFATFSGPVRSGTVRFGTAAQGRNTGLAVLTQSFDYTVSGTITNPTNVDSGIVMVLPQGAQIINIVVDQVVVPTASSTSTISVGTTSGGAELMAATTTTAGGRFTGAATAATQLAWQTSTTADTPVYVRYAVGGGNTTAGRAIVTINYVQRNPDGSTSPAYNQV
jgi:hypothetical protein